MALDSSILYSIYPLEKILGKFPMWSAIESMHQKKIRRYAHVHENHDSNQEQGFYPISYYLFKKIW